MRSDRIIESSVRCYRAFDRNPLSAILLEVWHHPMPRHRKRPRLDACRLLGNRRLTSNHVRAVLESLPDDTRPVSDRDAFATAIEQL